MAIDKLTTKTKGTKYKATFSTTINGKKARQSKTFSKKSEAQEWLNLREAEKARSRILGVSSNSNKLKKITFKEFCTNWLSRSSIRVTAGTLVEYKSKINKKMIPFFGDDKLLTEITYENLELFQIHLKKKYGIESVTINLYISLLKQIFRNAYENDYLSHDPAKKLKLIKYSKDDFKFWNKCEIDIFIKKGINWYFYDFVLVALNTGMRIGELSALKPSDIDFKNDWIRVSSSVKKNLSIGSTKGKTNRSIPMNNRVKEILLRRTKNLKDNELIFTYKNKVINITHFTDRHWRPFQEDILELDKDRRIRFHDLRHTFASHFITSKSEHATIFLLQKVLGHSDIKETMKYSHLCEKELKLAKDVVYF